MYMCIGPFELYCTNIYYALFVIIIIIIIIIIIVMLLYMCIYMCIMILTEYSNSYKINNNN